MKTTSITLVLAAISVAGCTNYTPSKANCFDSVSRNSNSFSFLAAPTDSVVSRGATSDCVFTPLGGANGQGVN